jgi:hypothetical protein
MAIIVGRTYSDVPVEWVPERLIADKSAADL